MNAVAVRHAHQMPFGAELIAGGGVAFRLWAPSRERVSVVVDGVEHALEPRSDGWFARTVQSARPGSRYAFTFAGDPLRVPDPASRFQPDGVHAPSVVVDPRAYAWRETAWRGRPWHEIVLYELHVGTFTPGGTYASAAERLDELVRLGVTAVELMPLAQPAGTRNWGYDGVLPFAPQHAYGTPDELKAFVDAAHARGLCVFLDVVYNHFGPEGNYLHAFADAFFTERHHTPWGAAINVDGERSQTVRELFVQNALYWLREYRFDGLRLDAVHEIRDDSPRPFLLELAARVRAGVEPDRHVQLVLENDANRARLLGAYDAQWNDDAHHAFHVLATGERDGYYRDYAREPARLLARALCEGFAYQGEASEHRGGAPRGEPSASLPATAFVGFLQNHDQIGNRAYGERLAALAPPQGLTAALAILLLAPSPPLLFMGEEWGSTRPFPFFCEFHGELAEAVRRGRRAEFEAQFAGVSDAKPVPDPLSEETFRSAILDWNNRGKEPFASRLKLVRDLLAARRSHVVPRLAALEQAQRDARVDGNLLTASWAMPDGAALQLVANLGSASTAGPADMAGEAIWGGAMPVQLPPWSV
ncbi:MAG TPA: malto-oligosyltrehalose trehalohydrolase, partial [Candidatus Elarobacter sp.]